MLPPVERRVFVSDLISGKREKHDSPLDLVGRFGTGIFRTFVRRLVRRQAWLRACIPVPTKCPKHARRVELGEHNVLAAFPPRFFEVSTRWSREFRALLRGLNGRNSP